MVSHYKQSLSPSACHPSDSGQLSSLFPFSVPKLLKRANQLHICCQMSQLQICMIKLQCNGHSCSVIVFFIFCGFHATIMLIRWPVNGEIQFPFLPSNLYSVSFPSLLLPLRRQCCLYQGNVFTTPLWLSIQSPSTFFQASLNQLSSLSFAVTIFHSTGAFPLTCSVFSNDHSSLFSKQH